MIFYDSLFLLRPRLLPTESIRSQILRFLFQWACSWSVTLELVLFLSPVPFRFASCSACLYSTALSAYPPASSAV